MLAGAILTETIFSLAGHRQVDSRSVFRRDYPVIPGWSALLIAGIIMVVNLIVDLLYGPDQPAHQH